MSDEANAGGTASGEQETITETQKSQIGAAENTSGSGSGSSGGGGSEQASQTDWPDDWRSRLTGGDEASMKLAERFGSPQAVWQKLLAQEQTIRRGAHKAAPSLPENATEEQKAEYRQALGVPATPDGYNVQFSREVGADESLNAMLQSYLAFAHERNIPPSAVKAAVEWQQQEILRQRNEVQAAAQRAEAEVERRLQSEYGLDYDRNMTLTKEFLNLNPGLKRAVKALPIYDIDVMRDIVNLALELTPIDRLHAGDAASGGKSLDERINDLSQKSIRGKLTPTEYDEYVKLTDAQIKRDERRERNAA